MPNIGSECHLTVLPERRPGLVPGTVEWFKEAVGPRLLKRLDDEIQAQPVGELNPTGARLLTAGLGLIYPTVSAVHVTHETTLAKKSDEELHQRLNELALELQRQSATTVPFIESDRQPISEPATTYASNPTHPAE